MKLKDTFITHMSNGEQILVDASGKFSGIIRNNESAAFIVECLKKETTVENIVDQMYEEYDASKEVLLKAVNDVVLQLRKAGAIDE